MGLLVLEQACQISLNLQGLLFFSGRLVSFPKHVVDLTDARIGGGECFGLDVLECLLLASEEFDEGSEKLGIVWETLAFVLDFLESDEVFDVVLYEYECLVVQLVLEEQRGSMLYFSHMVRLKFKNN